MEKSEKEFVPVRRKFVREKLYVKDSFFYSNQIDGKI